VAKLNKYIFERQSGRRSGSVSGKEIESISTYNPEHEDGWEALKKDLADIGITEADISRHRVLILNLLKDAVAAGKLEEPSLGGEEKEDYSLMDIDDDNDNDEGSVEFFEITPDEDSGSMSGVHNTSISAPRSEWFERVLRQGKFRVAKRLLGAADGPHLRDESGRTLLHHAALLGHSNLTGLILDKHADIDVRDNDGWTPLKCAVYKRHVVCARQLIERGADFKRRYGSSQRTLLHSAAGLGHDEIVRMLLDRGALADTQDDGGFTALHIAAWNGCLTTVRLLLEAGARMDIEDWWGDTPASLGRKSPLEAEVREGMVRTILQYSRSRAQDQSSEVRAGLEDKFDQVVEFLMKEDIYDDSSQNNVFETSMVNGNFSDLLRSQSALMSLGEELFEVWMSNSEDATVSIEE
jgi:ankyrin repeat protein